MNTSKSLDRLTIYTDAPLNAGTPPHLLHTNPITPTEQFFVRNHAGIPHVNPNTYRLTVDGLVANPLALSLADLRDNYPPVTVTAALQCAGIRRVEMNAARPIPGELLWDLDAIGNATWTGVPLRAILEAAALQPDAAHIAFEGLDRIDKPGTAGFGGSVPADKARGDEVLLAYAMNGQPLTPEHGHPLRVIVPGYIGARSVKWLSTITAQAEPSDNYFQRRAYRLYPPHMNADNVDWDAGEMLGELALNAIITAPQTGDTVPAGPITLTGVAVTGDAVIERVELSADGGQSWQQAGLTSQPQRWAWCLWQAQLDLPPGTHELVVRAVDSAGNTQPESVHHCWNFKGYMNNSYHRITLTAVTD